MNDSKISYLKFFFCIFFYVCPVVPSSDFIFNFGFCSRKSQSQQKLAILLAITHFTIKFCSKNLTHFTNLNSLEIKNNMLPRHSQKPFWPYKFSASMFLFGVRKNNCTAPFLDAQELHSWSTLNANVCIFLYISLRNLSFQRRSKVLPGKAYDGGSGEGEWLNLRWLLRPCKIFYNFSF